MKLLVYKVLPEFHLSKCMNSDSRFLFKTQQNTLDAEIKLSI